MLRTLEFTIFATIALSHSTTHLGNFWNSIIADEDKTIFMLHALWYFFDALSWKIYALELKEIPDEKV